MHGDDNRILVKIVIVNALGTIPSHYLRPEFCCHNNVCFHTYALYTFLLPPQEHCKKEKEAEYQRKKEQRRAELAQK